MKAMVYRQYGSPDVVHLEETEIPAPGDHAEGLKNLLEAGKIIPEIEKVYPLGQLPEAMRRIETGHARAKIVIAI